MGEERRLAGQAGGQGLQRLASARGVTPNAACTLRSVAAVLTSEKDRPTVSWSTRSRCRPSSRAAPTTSAARPGTDTWNVSKKARRQHLEPGPGQSRGGTSGELVGASRDRPQALRTVVDGVHRGHDGEQHLGGADVGGRLVPADVLLPGLQGEAVGRASLGVDRDPDQAAGQVPLQARGDGHVAGVRAAVEQRDAEALGRADHDVRPQRARRLEQGQGEQVGGDDDERVPGVRGLGDRARVDDPARRRPGTAAARRRARPPGSPSARSATTHVDAHGLGAGAHDLDGLRKRVRVDDERSRRLPVAAAYQRHRLRGRGALVEERRVGGRQPGQVADHRLEVEQGLEASLGDLRLVRRVGGVPARVLEHVAPDHRRGERAVVAQADHRLRRAVAGREVTKLAGDVLLRGRGRKVQRPGRADPTGDGGRHQGLERLVADGPRACARRPSGRSPMWRSAKDTGQSVIERAAGSF